MVRQISGYRWRAAVTVAALCTMLVSQMATAGAQDPYGSTTTTAGPPGQTPSCQLKDDSAPPGGSATVAVRSVPRGDEVRVLFDGQEVASAEATGPGGSPHVNVDITFTVPETAEAGPHQVAASGPTFSVECQTGNGDDFEVTPEGEVMGAQETRGEGSGGTGLARTGIYVGFLLALAAVLLLLGRALMDASHLQRRQAARERTARRRSRGSSGTRPS